MENITSNCHDYLTEKLFLSTKTVRLTFGETTSASFGQNEEYGISKYSEAVLSRDEIVLFDTFCIGKEGSGDDCA
jgi:hypothetical protein